MAEQRDRARDPRATCPSPSVRPCHHEVDPENTKREPEQWRGVTRSPAAGSPASRSAPGCRLTTTPTSPAGIRSAIAQNAREIAAVNHTPTTALCHSPARSGQSGRGRDHDNGQQRHHPAHAEWRETSSLAYGMRACCRRSPKTKHQEHAGSGEYRQTVNETRRKGSAWQGCVPEFAAPSGGWQDFKGFRIAARNNHAGCELT